MCNGCVKRRETQKINVRILAVVLISLTIGFFIVWLQGIPGIHHGAYLALASLHNIRTGLWFYNEHNGCLPPAVATNSDGIFLYSWRIEIYQEYVSCGAITTTEGNSDSSIDYDRLKSWDSPDNLRLQKYGEHLFEYTPNNRDTNSHANDRYLTYYMAITGSGTAFDPATPRNIGELPDDLIIVVRVERSKIHWMEPGDLSIDDLMESEKAKQLLLGNNGYAVLFADGKPWVLSGDLSFSDLCKFMNIAGAKKYDREIILAPYRVVP